MAKEVIRKFVMERLDAIVTCPIQDVKGLFDLSKPGRTIFKDWSDQFNERINKDTGVRDWRLFSNNQDYLLESSTRNVTIHLKGICFLNKVNHAVATERMDTLVIFINKADTYYMPHDISESANGMYLNLLADEYEKHTTAVDLEEQIKQKREAKALAKKACQNKWFVIGKKYYQKQTTATNDIVEITEFECVKYIYTIGKNPVNCVVMKRLSGEMGKTARPLSKIDCKLYHIKYQKNLYMFPMSRRFYTAEDYIFNNKTADNMKKR